jgi:polyhydroxyalkanoate synthesis repressor PhaR
LKTIKRYKNRRLYDTERKRYITHAELIADIKLKEAFIVIDNASGNDITLAVLGQVLVGETKSWDDIKGSKELLMEVINLGGEKSMSILKNTYLATVGMYNLTKKKAEEVIDSLIKAGEISNKDRKDAVMELLDRAEKSTVSFKDRVMKEGGSVQKEVSKVIDRVNFATKKDIDALNKRLDKLTKALDKLQD